MEINPHVAALRDAFLISEDDRRFKVILGDETQLVQQPPHRYDLLLLDGFDLRGLPPSGILVANLHYKHAHFETCVTRIRAYPQGCCPA